MLVETIEDLEALKIEHGVQQASSLNIVITDGRCVVGLHYISKSHEQIPPTLYYSLGQLCTCDNGISHMNDSSCDKAVLIVSEKLTDYQDEWNEVPPNHLIEIDNLLSVGIKRLPSF